MNNTIYANNIFEQPWWLDIVAPNSWKEYFVHDSKGNVLARQAVVVNKNKILMPSLTQTMGIWMADDIVNDYGAQKRAIQGLLEQMSEYKNVNICLAPENNYILPYRWDGYIMEPRFTYRINDLSNLDELYTGFNKTAKKNIKSATKKVTISTELDFSELWEMLNKTFESQNRKNPMHRDLVRDIVLKCEEQKHGRYVCAKDPDGNVHSCAYFVYDEKVCYYLLGATDSEYRSSGAQSLVIWEGIKFAAEHSKRFDFEGSMIEGIENFFRQFNNQCCTYYEVRKQPLVEEIKLLMKPKIKKIIGYKI